MIGSLTDPVHLCQVDRRAVVALLLRIAHPLPEMATKENQPAPSLRNILCLGDSLTWGYCLPFGYPYPYGVVLQGLLVDFGVHEAKVHVKGVNGEVTQSMLRRARVVLNEVEGNGHVDENEDEEPKSFFLRRLMQRKHDAEAAKKRKKDKEKDVKENDKKKEKEIEKEKEKEKNKIDEDIAQNGKHNTITSTSSAPYDLVIILGGTNDIGTGVDVLDAAANLKNIHALCHEKSIPTIALTLPCKTNAQEWWEKERKSLNEEIRGFGKEKREGGGEGEREGERNGEQRERKGEGANTDGEKRMNGSHCSFSFSLYHLVEIGDMLEGRKSPLRYMVMDDVWVM